MFAYSFGNPSDRWNQKELNSPLPCPDGISCSRPICCYNVHPGEEGVRRKYFEGRRIKDRVTGEMVDQPPCVRLVGNDKDDIPGYYRRRTAKMSWPAWCAQEKISVPQVQQSPKLRVEHWAPPRHPRAQVKAQVKPEVKPQVQAQPVVKPQAQPPWPTPHELIAQLLPHWTPPSLYSMPGEPNLQHFGLPDYPVTRAIVNNYLTMMQVNKDPIVRDAIYMTTLSLSARYPPNHPLQYHLRIADNILASRLAHHHVAEMNAFGDTLYAKVKVYLKQIEHDARANGLWMESFTPEKATGILLSYLKTFPERTFSDKEFESLMVECMESYRESLAAA
ncbi:MAG: hypothetical protein EBT03_08990 [Betaproteobacteria bacterium]|nr:hypothetical protein [Betaproteobacteria bacterium]